MAELFQRNKSTISRHFKNIFECGELRQDMVIAKNATTSPGAPRAGGTQLPNALALPLQNIARYRRKKCIFAP